MITTIGARTNMVRLILCFSSARAPLRLRKFIELLENPVYGRQSFNTEPRDTVSRVCLAAILSFFPSLSVAQAVVAYPDLQVMTPTSQISIGNPTPSTREFRFSHITWNAGVGPLEIRPNYNPSTQQSQGLQRLYTRNASGGLTPVMDVPIAL
jgi:hypothetical protein